MGSRFGVRVFRKLPFRGCLPQFAGPFLQGQCGIPDAHPVEQLYSKARLGFGGKGFGLTGFEGLGGVGFRV